MAAKKTLRAKFNFIQVTFCSKSTPSTRKGHRKSQEQLYRLNCGAMIAFLNLTGMKKWIFKMYYAYFMLYTRVFEEYLRNSSAFSKTSSKSKSEMDGRFLRF